MAKNDGRYSRIKSRFWHDEKSGQWDDDTKLLALYLLTCPHGNILGCFVLPKLYICADLRWTEERLRKPFAKLLEEGFLEYDENTSLILINNWLKHNPIENGNQAIAGVQMLKELPKSYVLESLLRHIESENKPHMQVLLDALNSMKPFGEPSSKQLREPLPEQNGKPVTVTVTETVTVEDLYTCASPSASASENEPPKKRKASPLSAIQEERFNTFWQAYPKKRSKGDAIKAWAKLKPDEELFERIMQGLEKAKSSYDWQKDGGQYIPYPATWLNATGWEDEYTPPRPLAPPPRSPTTNTQRAIEAARRLLAKEATPDDP